MITALKAVTMIGSLHYRTAIIAFERWLRTITLTTNHAASANRPKWRGGRIMLTWSGIVEALSMPPLLGELVMRLNIEDQFRGMVHEIERREGQRREQEAKR